MRLERFSLFGVKDKFVTTSASIDLGALGPGLIAIVGPNGAGKTTIMETPQASLFKSFASRPGSLYGKMAGRDAYLESLWSDGAHQIMVRLLIDAEASKTEGYVFVDGQSITTGRAAEFEREVSRLFGSRELFLASVFAAQTKAGNFLSLPKSRRKELFIELLGLAYLADLSTRCGDCRKSAETQVGQQRALLGALIEETADRDDFAQQLEGARAALEQSVGLLDGLRADEASLVSLLEGARRAASELVTLQQSLESARTDLTRSQTLVDEIIGRQNRERQARDSQLVSWKRVVEQSDEAKIIGRYDSRRQSLTTRQDSLAALIAEEPAITAATAALESLGVERAQITDRVRSFDDLKQRLAAAKANLRVAVAEYNAADGSRKSALESLKRSTALLGNAPCAATDSWFKAAPARTIDEPSPEAFDLARTCPLIASAQEAKGRLDRFGDSDFEQRISLAEEARDQADSDVAALEIEFEQSAPDLKRSEARLAEITVAEEGLRRQVARRSLVENAKTEIAAVSQELNGLGLEQEMEIEELRGKVAEAQGAIGSLQAAAKEAAAADEIEVTDARRRVQETQAIVAARSSELESARSQSASVATVERDLQQLQARKAEQETELRRLQDATARLTTRLEILDQKLAQAETLRAAIGELAQEVGDWAILETALGKDGVQALEIDAAGPEVSAITNELLESCYGPTFSISLETLRAKKSSPGEFSEAFDIRVFKKGAEMDVEMLSGGEMVIVSEALSLALAIFNTRKSGIRYETLWRDETAGALWPENALAYVDMLRRARELGGYHQVIYVTHQPEVWEAADARIFVNDGKVSFSEEISLAA